jgi:hypothetical protein
VAFGVGLGLIIGIAKIMWGWSALAVVAPSYLSSSCSPR